MVHAVFVVGLVVLGALVVLAVRVARLRARVGRLERAGAELSRTLAAVQGWAAKELRAVRHEFTVVRVDASAAEVLAQLETTRAASPAPSPEPDDDPEDHRATVAMPAPAAEPNDDGKATSILDLDPSMYSAGLEPAHPRLGPDEQTPPQRGRVSVLVPAFRERGA